jgi:hypothetical protein
MILYYLNIQFFITLSIWQGGPHFILFFKNKKKTLKPVGNHLATKIRWWQVIYLSGGESYLKQEKSN